MDFLYGNIKQIYFKYLAAAFGSALISSIYSIVDMAMVGQYQGPDGTAALAVVAPVWNVIYSLGLLTGIGGSVIYSIERGGNAKHSGNENQYFTAAAAHFLWCRSHIADTGASVSEAGQMGVPSVFIQSNAGSISTQ